MAAFCSWLHEGLSSPGTLEPSRWRHSQHYFQYIRSVKIISRLHPEAWRDSIVQREESLQSTVQDSRVSILAELTTEQCSTECILHAKWSRHSAQSSHGGLLVVPQALLFSHHWAFYMLYLLPRIGFYKYFPPVSSPDWLFLTSQVLA